MNKFVNAGYIRNLPEWVKFVNKAVKENRNLDDPYFLYILQSLGRGYSNFSEPPNIELLEECLIILRKYNKEIKTIFKPSHSTDMEKFNQLVKKVEYNNYVIDYGHPMVLSSKAKFVLANRYSTTMLDAFYQGIPIIEYTCYDHGLLEMLGGQSYGGEFCDFFIHRNNEELEVVLHKIIREGYTVKRDPEMLKANYPDPPVEFYEVIQKIL